MTKTRKPDTAKLLPLDDYDLIIVSYSGGKDSLACILHLLELGVDRSKLELWHQCIDGEPGSGDHFMDWPITEAYVKATGEALGLPVRLQWKVGGFRREMLRDGQATATVGCELRDGEAVTLPGGAGKPGTRRMFPQMTSKLSQRWCSAYLKIDVCARAIVANESLADKRILIVTGERAEESPARSLYSEVELHRRNTKKRTVHQWRPVLDWSESQVWEIIERAGIKPHPAYYLGWGRVSCMACIFGDNDQWATVREIAPEQFAAIAAYETEFGKTINRERSVIESADKGTAYIDARGAMLALALSEEYPSDLKVDGDWQLPSGAYQKCGGPT